MGAMHWRLPSVLVVGVWLLVLSLPGPAAAQRSDPRVDTPFQEAPRPIIGASREPLDDLPQIENFRVVGHTVITNPGQTIERGRNGSASLAPPCAYVGNRLGRRSGTGPDFGRPVRPPEIAIVDIGQPSEPRVVGHLATPAGGTTRELRAFPEMDTLYVMNFAAEDDTGMEVNNLMIYDISDCENPVLKQTIDLGEWHPHEFFVWGDRSDPGRVLVYMSSINSEPWLRVYDVTGAIQGQTPELVATLTMDPVLPADQPVGPLEMFDPDEFRFTDPPDDVNNTVHSMSTNEAGTRVYVAGMQAGFYVLDSSRLAEDAPCIPDNVTADETTNQNSDLCLRKINPNPEARVDWHPPRVGITHSANKLPGRPYVLVSDERNGTTTCPWTHGWIIDITNEAYPMVMSPWMVPENIDENCFDGGPGDPALMREFSSHQILPFRNLFFQTWYSAGLRAWDVANPWLPLETGVFVPKPEFPDVVEPFRDSPDVWTWPHPVLYNRLLYVVDENSGLFILRYTGRRRNELPTRGIFEGNAVHFEGRVTH
jgi:hypothetical protein